MKADGSKPSVEEIDGDDFRAMQKLVGGNFRSVGVDKNIDIYCNEDGDRLGLPLNFSYIAAAEKANWNLVPRLVGDVFVARVHSPKMVSLTDKDIKKYTALFKQ